MLVYSSVLASKETRRNVQNNASCDDDHANDNNILDNQSKRKEEK